MVLLLANRIDPDVSTLQCLPDMEIPLPWLGALYMGFLYSLVAQEDIGLSWTAVS